MFNKSNQSLNELLSDAYSHSEETEEGFIKKDSERVETSFNNDLGEHFNDQKVNQHLNDGYNFIPSPPPFEEIPSFPQIYTEPKKEEDTEFSPYGVLNNTEKIQIPSISSFEEETKSESVEQPNIIQENVQPLWEEPIQSSNQTEFVQYLNDNTNKHTGIDSNSFNSITTESIKQVIQIVDKYRSYEKDIQDMTRKFVNLDSKANEEEVVFAVINLNQKKKDGLKDLVSLKEEERTSRAFSLMALSDDRLSEIRDLVMLFNLQAETIENNGDRVLYCRNLEKGIETIEENVLKLLKPIEVLF